MTRHHKAVRQIWISPGSASISIRMSSIDLSPALRLLGAAVWFAACAPAGPAQLQPVNPALLNAASAEMNQTAPATYQAEIVTSSGTFVVEVHREWAPIGADRFYNLVRNGYYDGVRFFRVVPDFVA